MSVPTKPRKRAVRLTPESLTDLNAALTACWQADDRAGRLTRETQADLLGVSVATVKRILVGEGVDRATLALAFKSLGLAWSDSCCESVEDDRPQVEVEVEVEVEGGSGLPGFSSEESGLARGRPSTSLAPPRIGQQAIAPPKRSPKRVIALGAATLALVSVAAWWNAFGHPGAWLTPRWVFDYNDAFTEGMARFHRADYKGARIMLVRALTIANAHDAAGAMAGAERLAGDLAEAQGRLTEASELYRSALEIRKNLGQEHTLPSLYDALGNVQTRLDDYDNAKRSLAASLDGYRRYDEPVGVAMACREIGSLAFGRGDLDGAQAWFRKSLEALKRTPNLDIETDVHGRQALVLLKRGRVAEAREGQRECLAYWTEKGHTRWIAASELHLGLTEERLDNPATALALVSRSKAGFESVGDGAGAAEANGHLRRLVSRKRSRIAAREPKG